MNLSSIILKLFAGNKEGWISTYSGKHFYPCDPQIDDICIEDIAHALSNICRFTGHCKDFYSVAQHAVLVSYLCDIDDDFEGLMHDGTEAYISDIARPLKVLPVFFLYRMVESNIHQTISRRFNLRLREPKSIKIADTRILGNEMKSLMNMPKENYMKYNPYSVIPRLSINNLPKKMNDVSDFDYDIKPWNSKTAEIMFLTRFHQLQEKKIK